MTDSLNQPKTVAILGGGPVGLAAAAHVLERGMEPIVLEAGPDVGHAVRQWGHVRMFSPWEYNIDKAAERLLAAVGWNAAARRSIRPAPSWSAQYLEPLATRTPLKDRIRTRSLVTSVGRAGFDKVKTKGRDGGALRDPLPERQGTGVAARRRRDRRHRHLVRAQPGRRRRPAGDRRARGAGPRSPTACPTCWAATARAMPARTVAVLGAGHSADRHADRSRASQGRGADDRDRSGCCAATRRKRPSAAAPTTSSPRAARWARPSPRWWRAARSGSRPAFASRTSAATASACASAPARPAAAATVTVDELVVATGFRPELDFLREIRLSLDPGAGMPAGAGAADRSQRA